MLTLIALLLAAPAPTHAAFYDADGHTWLVDLRVATLQRADAWLVPEGDGLRRVRRQVHGRSGHDVAELPAPPSRWTTLDTARLGERRWTPLRPAPNVPAPGEACLEDELHVLQFLGDRVSALRTRRVDFAGAATATAEAFTLDSATGAAAAAPATPPASLGGCATTPAGGLWLEGAGGARRQWHVLSAPTDGCAGEASAVPAGPAAGGVAMPAGAVDARVAADGTTLSLRGAPLPTEGGLLTGLAAGLGDPCEARTLWLTRPGAVAREIGRVAALDGLRWLDEGSPLVAQAALWFRPLDQACALPLSAHSQPVDATHHCRLDEAEGRPWAGPADLSATVQAEWVKRGRLAVEVTVQDAQVTADDQLRLWVGEDRRPTRAEVSQAGLRVRGGKKARRAARGRLQGKWTRRRGGYTVTLTVDASLLGDPPALTVAVDDVDKGGAQQTLWVAGDPIDSRQRRATPLAGGR